MRSEEPEQRLGFEQGRDQWHRAALEGGVHQLLQHNIRGLGRRTPALAPLDDHHAGLEAREHKSALQPSAYDIYRMRKNNTAARNAPRLVLRCVIRDGAFLRQITKADLNGPK